MSSARLEHFIFGIALWVAYLGLKQRRGDRWFLPQPPTPRGSGKEAAVASSDYNSGTSTYWSRPHLTGALLDAVAVSGLDLRTATPDALAPLDQFHGGGKEATRTLARQAEVAAGMRVLDVGGGLGGPARMLAVE